MTPRRRKSLAKKKVAKKEVRVLCDFCESSSSNRHEPSPDKQEPESLEGKVKRLRVLNERMAGRNLYGLNYGELQALKTNLKEAFLILKKQMEKMKESEKLLEQKREGGDKDEAGLLAPPKSSCSSSGEKQDDGATPQIEYERRKAESMESEFERLWLLKERMSGRKLDNMTSSELCTLGIQMQLGLRNWLGITGHSISQSTLETMTDYVLDIPRMFTIKRKRNCEIDLFIVQSDGRKILDSSKLNALITRLRAELQQPLRVVMMNRGPDTELVVTNPVELSGKGRPQVFHDISLALKKINTCIFSAWKTYDGRQRMGDSFPIPRSKIEEQVWNTLMGWE